MPSQRRRLTPRNQVRRAFSRPTLKRVCEMYELEFCDAYDMERHIIEERNEKGNNFYYFRDNGADILFVAHLDTVVDHHRRRTEFCETADGPVVHSGALDDRLGAYIGLELLPKLLGEGWADVLLTVGEESHQSTAEFFTTDKAYNWVIEFDRKGDDVVMYQYDDYDTAKLVRESGARMAKGSFSDIAELEHLEVKCFNWGCGYEGNYHSTRGIAYLETTYDMVVKFMRFYAANSETRLSHEKRKPYSYSPKGGSNYGGSGGERNWNNGYGSGGSHVGGSTRTHMGKRQRWDLGTGWVDIDDSHVDKRWSQVLKIWVASDPKSEVVYWMNKAYDTFADYWAEEHAGEEMSDQVKEYLGIDDDPFDAIDTVHLNGRTWQWNEVTGMYEAVEESIEVGGVEYPSYMAWWNDTHGADEQVDEEGNWINPAGAIGSGDVVADIDRALGHSA